MFTKVPHQFQFLHQTPVILSSAVNGKSVERVSVFPFPLPLAMRLAIPISELLMGSYLTFKELVLT